MHQPHFRNRGLTAKPIFNAQSWSKLLFFLRNKKCLFSKRAMIETNFRNLTLLHIETLMLYAHSVNGVLQHGINNLLFKLMISRHFSKLDGFGIKGKLCVTTRKFILHRVSLLLLAFIQALLSTAAFPQRFSFFSVCLAQWLHGVAPW